MIWLSALLITVLAMIIVALGVAGVQRPSPQPVRVQSQSTASHAAMSGDFLRSISV